MNNANEVRVMVRERYGALVEKDGCGCGPSCCGGAETSVASMEQIGYSAEQATAAPKDADLGLGCGNPLAFAGVKPGETVLDLGSGAGIDAFLAAREVGPKGRVLGVDMTPPMIDRARATAAREGYANVEFRLGEIENLPVADATVDVIISNCVINLSPEKSRVFREAFRVLRPGGRFAVSDVVTRGEVPEKLRQDVLLWAGCIAGALQDTDYAAKLAAAGFEEIGIEPTRIYGAEDAREFLVAKDIDVDAMAAQVDGKIMSAFVRARKPALRG